MKRLLLYILLIVTMKGYGQWVEQKSFFISPTKTGAPVDTIIPVQSDQWISSVVIRVKPGSSFDGARIISGNQVHRLTRDEHVDGDDGMSSNLIIFDQPVKELTLIPYSLRDSVILFLIHDHQFEPPVIHHDLQPGPARVKSGITKPDMIDQSIWRAGLPHPNYDRIQNQVHNSIIHHSATSNTITDFTSAIRNIYLYHTQVNRWSDIGYNYLITPDGTIYKGRDPADLQQDEVLGAHFCRSNTGTLGICLLGTYSDLAPADTTLESLVILLAWKLAKDRLDPLGIFPHPLNNELAVIAGHRDGCATLCPGDSVYARLSAIRNFVDQAIRITGVEWFGDDGRITQNDQGFMVYPNPFTSHLVIGAGKTDRWIRVMDTQGRMLYQTKSQSNTLDLGFLPQGMYYLFITTDGHQTYYKILK